MSSYLRVAIYLCDTVIDIAMDENPVGNKRNSTNDDTTLKPLRKIRAVSGYNLWHAEFMKTTGTIFFVTFTIFFSACHYLQKLNCWQPLLKKNHESAKRWNLLSEEDKELFREKATSTKTDEKPLNFKQQSTKILNHLQELVSEYVYNHVQWSINYTYKWVYI